MKTSRCLLVFCAFLPLVVPSAPAGEMPPPIMGDWEGTWVDPPARSYAADNRTLVGRVIGLGGDRYRIQLMQEFDKRAEPFVDTEANLADGKLSFNVGAWQGEVTDTAIAGQAPWQNREPIRFELHKVRRLSATLGKKPPAGAVILFDGTNLDAWQHPNGDEPTWTVEDGGVFECLPRNENNNRGGDLVSRQRFGDARLHLEFKLTYEPANRGQGRANSGVFFGDYEAQILDSYGLAGYWNECGALYKVSPPKVNACGPPEQWQTYDITYRAPRFNPDGSVAEHPRMTVRLNDILIHNDQVLAERTMHSFVDRQRPPAEGPVRVTLQDHGHHIQFRNMWLVEINP